MKPNSDYLAPHNIPEPGVLQYKTPASPSMGVHRAANTRWATVQHKGRMYTRAGAKLVFRSPGDQYIAGCAKDQKVSSGKVWWTTPTYWLAHRNEAWFIDRPL